MKKNDAVSGLLFAAPAPGSHSRAALGEGGPEAATAVERRCHSPVLYQLSYAHQGSGQANTVETWRPIPGYAYEASSLGSIRRLGKAKPLSPKTHWKGYLQVQMSRDGVARSFKVHVLVALAFHGPRPAAMVIDHLDGDKKNNRPSNLEYVTNRENNRRYNAARRAA